MSKPNEHRMNTSNIERLELEAMNQRSYLHQSVKELKSHVSQVRHELEPEVYARKHFVPVSLGAAFLCLLTGYGFGGFFSR